jgi:NlpE N-terminal domain
MKGSYIAMWMVAVLCMVACGSNEGSKTPKAEDIVKQDAAEIKPTGPPARVNGTFKGVLPCDNCRETEAVLTIKDDKYSYTQLFKGMKVKGSNIGTKSGYCVFDSGIVKLLSDNKAGEMFRIVSEDTLKPLDAAAKPLKGKVDFLLIRTAKQEKL